MNMNGHASNGETEMQVSEIDITTEVEFSCES
jgi:hypothetical protein